MLKYDLPGSNLSPIFSPRLPSYIVLCMLLCLVLLLVPPAHAQAPVTHFEHVTFDDGLSDNTVYSVLQDKTGFLWFGTQDGLNKYDGHTFTIFKHDPYDANSISNNNAGNLFIDRDGIIWIGTWGDGLDRLDPNTNQITNYQHDPQNPNSLSHSRVQTIFQDSSGTIWVGTAGGGLDKFNPQAQTFTAYKPNSDNPHSISNDRIWRIDEDKQGNLWVATSEGLNKFNPETEQFTAYFHDPDDPNSISHNLIRTLYVDRAGTLWVGTEQGLNRYQAASDNFERFFNYPTVPNSLSDDIINAIYEDSSGRLWIGTRSGGLNILDRDSGQFTRYVNNPQNSDSLSYNDIRAITEDDSGILWFATRGGGLNKLSPTSGKFIHYASQPNNPNSLNNNEVRAIFKDSAGILWIGTKGGGLNQYNPETKSFMAYQARPDDTNSLSSNDVYAIYQDNTGIFWLGTAGGGMNRFDPQTEQFEHYRFDPNDANSLSSEDVQTIIEDQDGMLWIGTKGGGLNKFNRTTGQFTRYMADPDNPTSLNNNDVYAIYQDKNGILWIGTYGGGLNRFDPQTEQFTAYQFSPEDPASLSNDNVHNIFADRQGDLWIATANGGLNKFNPETGEFTHFTADDGLASNVVYAIQQDNNGNLWVTTNKSLSMVDPATKRLINYDSGDGLERIIYREGASYQSDDGTLYFGGINGLTQFDPNQIEPNSHIPPVVITKFSLLNQPIDLGLPTEKATELALSYEDDVLSFEFAALDFISPDKNQFAYKLDGFDDDWIMAASRPFATYTNLDPGRYTFRVKAANNAGLWNEEGTAIEIVVQPPFWETWWFRTFAVLVVIGSTLGVYHLRVRAIETQRNALEAQVKERTIELIDANAHLQQVTNRLQDEFLLAQNIQQNLLPPEKPDWEWPDVICYSRPAHEVGGDYYAYHAFSHNGQLPKRFAIMLGDVSGKGMPAALLMAVSVGALKNGVSQNPPPNQEELLSGLNDTLKPYTQSTKQNSALCYVEINEDMVVHMLNAGGIAPLIKYANGTIKWADTRGLPLGLEIEDSRTFQKVSQSFISGDMIILVSDGVLEATAADGREMFGFDRLEQAILNGPSTSASAMLHHLQQQVTTFINDADPHDDITIVVVKV